MRSMTVKEAKASFDRMLETANREGVVLRDGDKDVAAVVSVSDAEMIRNAKALAVDQGSQRARFRRASERPHGRNPRGNSRRAVR